MRDSYVAGHEHAVSKASKKASKASKVKPVKSKQQSVMWQISECENVRMHAAGSSQQKCAVHPVVKPVVKTVVKPVVKTAESSIFRIYLAYCSIP